MRHNISHFISWISTDDKEQKANILKALEIAHFFRTAEKIDF